MLFSPVDTPLAVWGGSTLYPHVVPSCWHSVPTWWQVVPAHCACEIWHKSHPIQPSYTPLTTVSYPCCKYCVSRFKMPHGSTHESKVSSESTKSQGLLSNAWHFDLRVVMLIMQQLSWWCNITAVPRGLKCSLSLPLSSHTKYLVCSQNRQFPPRAPTTGILQPNVFWTINTFTAGMLCPLPTQHMKQPSNNHR